MPARFTSRRKRVYAVVLLIMLLSLSGNTAARAANGSVVYTYDALGRVLTASYDTNVIVIYIYDANGNRTQQVVNVNSAHLSWAATPVTPCTVNCWDAALWN